MNTGIFPTWFILQERRNKPSTCLLKGWLRLQWHLFWHLDVYYHYADIDFIETKKLGFIPWIKITRVACICGRVYYDCNQ